MKNRKAGRPTNQKVKNNALMQAITIIGGVVKLANIIGVSQPCVSSWLYEGINIPAHHIPKIVKATKGQVRPEELRPDIEWDMPRPE